MAYRTNRALALNLATGGKFAYPFILPARSSVILVEGLSGTDGDGFACGDERQLATLTGNRHDPVYRYTRVPANAVEGDTEAERATIARLVAKEAEIAREAAARKPHPSPYMRAGIVTLRSGRVFLVVDYSPGIDDFETEARAAAQRLDPEGGEVWDGVQAYPCLDTLRDAGPGVWELPTPYSQPEGGAS